MNNDGIPSDIVDEILKQVQTGPVADRYYLIKNINRI